MPSFPRSFPRWLFAPIGILVLAVALQLIPSIADPYFTPPAPLVKLLPEEIPGWTSEDLPMGDTEQMRERVLEVLSYDDAFYRLYRRGGMEVGVYVVYWKPGSVHPIEAATHSPDLCWTNSGWIEREHDYARVPTDGHGGLLKEGQYRLFGTRHGQRAEVLFWHLQGGRISGYAMGPSNRWEARLPVLLSNQIDSWFNLKRREQYFIRISTNQTVDALLADPIWPEIVRSLAPLGLKREGA